MSLVRAAQGVRVGSWFFKPIAQGVFKLAARVMQIGAFALASLFRAGISNVIGAFRHASAGVKVILDLLQIGFDIAIIIASIMVSANAVMARGRASLGFWGKFKYVLSEIGRGHITRAFGVARDTIASGVVDVIGVFVGLDTDVPTFLADFDAWRKGK